MCDPTKARVQREEPLATQTVHAPLENTASTKATRLKRPRLSLCLRSHRRCPQRRTGPPWRASRQAWSRDTSAAVTAAQQE
eukprot:CAMPEP_0194522130 /NCGR_PEP_ID=MMETSP0253-20130528/56617_1 /TAXON_ID=2966 /ORGANISM="Noctiluca scintillans" /LENGTH=80 /DNA_ID=CAMNT_0039366539 /DNA_START=352 /DNA_END=594 /DNA_ORIENTATION=-